MLCYTNNREDLVTMTLSLAPAAVLVNYLFYPVLLLIY